MFEPTVDAAILGLIGVIIGAFLTYQYGSYKESKQKILTERIALYRPVSHCLTDLLYLDDADPNYKTKAKEVADNLNRLGNELLLFAPDNVYREFLKTLQFKKGDSGECFSKFLIVLRKELIGKTTITSDDSVHLELT
jgi:hypothetical protein